MGALTFTGWVYFGPGPAAVSGQATDVVLPSGSGLSGVAGALRKAGVIRSRWSFAVAAVLTGRGRRLQAGEYEFRSRATLAEILSSLAEGRVVRHLVTVPEGLTSADAAEILRRTAVLTGPVSTPAEGAILPETYQVQRGESRAMVLSRMEAARDRVLTSLWARRAPGLPLAGPADAVVLASIVEKETARPDERPRIAAVFLNRLKKGMRLESDPTVIYGLTRGEPLGHGLRASEMMVRTPFNTYLNAGLPPTPIANPGRASLEAVMNPARTDDLYFVADGTGGHVFAATFDAHQRNVAHWRAIEAARREGGPA